MKNVLLINPGHDDSHEAYKHKSHRLVHRDPPPIGILYVGTFLKRNGYEVDLIDTHTEEDYKNVIQNYINSNNYVYIGITVIIGKFLKNANELTSFIRTIDPKLPIVWGGIMASIMPDAILNEYKPDYIVRYEGEETSLELANALLYKNDIQNVKGISYILDEKIIHNDARIPKKNLDDYPIPKWELFGKGFNIQQVPYYYLIMSSRGCPFNCTFCYKHSIDYSLRKSMPSWRPRSAEHIIEELEYIHQNTGTTVFTFGDDNFFVNKKRALKVLDYFKNKKLYIEECIGHIGCIDDEIIDAMGGIVQTFIFSVETASQRLQKYINKKLNLNSVSTIVNKFYKLGIVSDISFICGLPTEEQKDLRANVEFMIELKKANPFARGNMYLYYPLPKTKLHDSIEDIYNIKLTDKTKDYENANFWVKSTNDPLGNKSRPWLTKENFTNLVLYGCAFNDAFQMCNLELEEETKTILGEHFVIREIFKGIESVNKPKKQYRPYVLDRVLNKEEIDLINDLQKY